MDQSTAIRSFVNYLIGQDDFRNSLFFITKYIWSTSYSGKMKIHVILKLLLVLCDSRTFHILLNININFILFKLSLHINQSKYSSSTFLSSEYCGFGGGGVWADERGGGAHKQGVEGHDGDVQNLYSINILKNINCLIVFKYSFFHNHFQYLIW